MPLLEHYRRALSREDINALPLGRFEGPIRIVAPEQARAVLTALRAESPLGFDTETKPTFKKGVCHPPSLLQLAGKDAVYLFRIQGRCLPEGLVELLEDPACIKTGVAMRDDLRELAKLTPFVCANCVDLGDVGRNLGIKTNGLRNMAANFLGFRISKNERCSNWSRESLSQSQIFYAATDAWVGRELHLRFQELGILDVTAP